MPITKAVATADKALPIRLQLHAIVAAAACNDGFVAHASAEAVSIVIAICVLIVLCKRCNTKPFLVTGIKQRQRKRGKEKKMEKSRNNLSLIAHKT